MKCLGCGSESEEELCKGCVDSMLEHTPLDYSQVIGRPTVEAIRGQGSIIMNIGPTISSPLYFNDPLPLTDQLTDLDIGSLSKKECEDLVSRIDQLLLHMGIPLDLEMGLKLYLSMEGLAFISEAVSAVDQVESRFEGMSPREVYQRIANVYNYLLNDETYLSALRGVSPDIPDEYHGWAGDYYNKAIMKDEEWYLPGRTRASST